MSNPYVEPITLNPLEYMEAKWFLKNPKMGKDDFFNDALLYKILHRRAQCIYDFVLPFLKDGKELTSDYVVIDNSADTLIKCIVPVLDKYFYSGSDQCTCYNLSIGQRMNIKNRHPMANNSEILYYREESSNNTFIVTTIGVSYHLYKRLIELEWRKIRSVVYDKKDDKFYFYTV